MRKRHLRLVFFRMPETRRFTDKIVNVVIYTASVKRSLNKIRNLVIIMKL